jgi:hypothetical protein
MQSRGLCVNVYKELNRAFQGDHKAFCINFIFFGVKTEIISFQNMKNQAQTPRKIVPYNTLFNN